MKSITLLALCIGITSLCQAQVPESFEQARLRSVQDDKPILLEFFREE